MRGIDLISGAGGNTTGGKMAGLRMLWAANHNPLVVKYHELNHPEVAHKCQDLHQADWSLVPKHDILLASPCCQGHSRAAGKKKSSKKADRERLFIVATRTTKPIVLELPEKRPIAARSFIDMDMRAYKWDHISNRVLATQKRVTNGRKQFGEVFLDAAYGSARSGRSIDNPIGTITTVNKHSLVIGDLIRPLSLRELAAAQTFDECYQWPASATATKMMSCVISWADKVTARFWSYH